MPEGPLGISRPLATSQCSIVIYQRAVGRPRNEPERKMVELEKRLASSLPHTPIDGSTIITNLPRESMQSNTFEVVAGLDEDFRGTPDLIQESYDRMKRMLLDVDDVARVAPAYVVAGDPRDVIDSA